MSYTGPDELGDPPAAAGEAERAAQREAALKQLLDPQARTRLGNIRMVRPELASMLENYLMTMAAQGRIQSVSDEQLKQILLSMQQPKRDFRISRR